MRGKNALCWLPKAKQRSGLFRRHKEPTEQKFQKKSAAFCGGWIAEVPVGINSLRFGHQLIQRQHRRHTLVLITALAGKVHAALARRTLFCARAADVKKLWCRSGLPRTRVCDFRSSPLLILIDPPGAIIRLDRRVGERGICRALNNQWRRRRAQISAHRKGRHGNHDDNSERQGKINPARRNHPQVAHERASAILLASSARRIFHRSLDYACAKLSGELNARDYIR